jgi:hypothetical protein
MAAASTVPISISNPGVIIDPSSIHVGGVIETTLKIKEWHFVCQLPKWMLFCVVTKCYRMTCVLCPGRITKGIIL